MHIDAVQEIEVVDGYRVTLLEEQSDQTKLYNYDYTQIKQLAWFAMSRVLINLSNGINGLCEPYFKQLKLDHLNYIHRDKNGNVVHCRISHIT